MLFTYTKESSPARIIKIYVNIQTNKKSSTMNVSTKRGSIMKSFLPDQHDLIWLHIPNRRMLFNSVIQHIRNLLLDCSAKNLK